MENHQRRRTRNKRGNEGTTVTEDGERKKKSKQKGKQKHSTGPKKKKSNGEKTKEATLERTIDDEAANHAANYAVMRNGPSQMMTANPLSLLDRFLQRTLTRREKGRGPVELLVKEFREYNKRENDYSRMTAFCQNAAKNRYKDVGCLDNNRVVLTFGSQPYIHANYVDGFQASKKFICTQAPLESTIQDFWYMVAQEGSRCIVMLCNYKEGKMDKCAAYLPPEIGQPKKHGLVTVTVVARDHFHFKEKTSSQIERTFLDVSWEANSVRVEHLHWMDWPDRGVPRADMGPIELVRHMQGLSSAPIIVHCSAGIGRTGCLVLIDMLYAQHEMLVPWAEDLREPLSEIRQSRNNSVQTEHQFLYCHQVMLNYLRRGGALSQPMAEAHDEWTVEYNKICSGF